MYNWWNTHWTAKIIPDVIIYSSTYGVSSLNRGPGGATGWALVLRGKQAFHLYGFKTNTNNMGALLGYGFNIGYSVYLGKDARNFNFNELFGGDSRGAEGNFGLGIESVTSGSYDNFGGYLQSYDIGFGPAVGGAYSESFTTTWPIL